MEKENKMASEDEQERTTTAGKWSVALALIPVGGILLLHLPLVLIDQDANEEFDPGALLGCIGICGFPMAFGSSLLGIVLAIVAIRRTHWEQGFAGLILNGLFLIPYGGLLIVIFVHG